MATKAKRKLKEIDFSSEGAHIALTHKDQGFSANGKPLALVLKAKSPEFIEKVQQVQVTMETPEFLERFFHLYGSDAEVLARLMGYVPPAQDTTDQPMEYSYEDYIQSRVDQFQVLKSLNDSEDTLTAIAGLDDDQLISVLEAQKGLEQYLTKSTEVASNAATEDATSINGTEVIKSEETSSVDNQLNKENNMPSNVEMVEKSALDAAQSELETLRETLQKANDKVAQFEAERKEAVLKAKSAVLAEVVAESDLEIVLKAATSLESDEEFTSFVEALKAIQKASSETSLTEEVGASGESDNAVEVSSLTALIKSKYSK